MMAINVNKTQQLSSLESPYIRQLYMSIKQSAICRAILYFPLCQVFASPLGVAYKGLCNSLTHSPLPPFWPTTTIRSGMATASFLGLVLLFQLPQVTHRSLLNRQSIYGAHLVIVKLLKKSIIGFFQRRPRYIMLHVVVVIYRHYRSVHTIEKGNFCFILHTCIYVSLLPDHKVLIC